MAAYLVCTSIFNKIMDIAGDKNVRKRNLIFFELMMYNTLLAVSFSKLLISLIICSYLLSNNKNFFTLLVSVEKLKSCNFRVAVL